MVDPLIEQAARALSSAQTILVLTGAGVSAESGVPTFREAQTGLWARYQPEKLASPEGWAADPGLVWRWYMARFGGLETVRPNPGHYALAALEAAISEDGREFVLFTQNVDHFHEVAGSRRVRHLHGNLASYRCSGCDRSYPLRPEDRGAEQPPSCPSCGCLIRPDVVWFGEMLPPGVVEEAWTASRRCDVMLVVGTSGQVYPAAQFPHVARDAGATVIDVNPDPTPISRIAQIYLQGASGVMVPRVVAAMGIETEGS